MDIDKKETAVFGGGCFWSIEAAFGEIRGVLSVAAGFAGGRKKNPTYEEVSTGQTGYAEVVKIEFDPEIISYIGLLTIYFDLHDPTSLNRQGNDIGEQYRSVIFWTTEKQKAEAEKMIIDLGMSGRYSRPIVTAVEPLTEFWTAPEYHQRYFEKNQAKPYCLAVISPKMKKFREKYKRYLKDSLDL